MQNFLLLISETSCIVDCECTFLQEATRQIHGRKMHWVLLPTIISLAAQTVHLEPRTGCQGAIIANTPYLSCFHIYYPKLLLLGSGDQKRGSAAPGLKFSTAMFMFLPLSLLANFRKVYKIFHQKNLCRELLKLCISGIMEFLKKNPKTKKTCEVYLYYLE